MAALKRCPTDSIPRGKSGFPPVDSRKAGCSPLVQFRESEEPPREFALWKRLPLPPAAPVDGAIPAGTLFVAPILFRFVAIGPLFRTVHPTEGPRCPWTLVKIQVESRTVLARG
ncbi:hypothetical protein HPB47_021394 [Ixodes persulcatus]|uniref:Uncharacterized protein n=1 Tax=Ixodes persulcatus TaxID=34615 RepID=A0AC60QCZ3_IXOPE|nr:hypothetical protein HPB47_021394 [Ixodes persulcatus]